MKKTLLTGMALGVGVLFASAANAGIVGSAHEFSAGAWGTTQICQPCHTPHGGDTTVTDAPLWNHEITTTVFTPYSSPTFQGGVPGQPTGVSQLCMSCHDGLTAVDAYTVGTGAGTVFITSNAAFGTDLSNDHPISFNYETSAAADTEIFPSGTASGLGGTIAADMLFGAANTQMECGSCHDVHNTVAAGNLSLLRVSNAGSDLCLTCHNK